MPETRSAQRRTATALSVGTMRPSFHLPFLALALPLLGCGSVAKFYIWQSTSDPQKTTVNAPATQCYDWSAHSEGNFLSGTREVTDREEAASQYQALLSIEGANFEPFDRNCFWTEYLWSKANFAACNSDERVTDETLERLVALPVDTPQKCTWDFSDPNGVVWRRLITARILAEAHVAAARRSDGARGRPAEFRAGFERQVVEAKKTLGTLAAISTALNVATAVLEGVDRGLRAPAPVPIVQPSLTGSVSLAAGAGVFACADNGVSCRDDSSVREWRSRCETQTSAQGPCYCAQAAVFRCYINHGCYAELAGARGASVTRAKLDASLREAIGLASSVGTACTGLPGPEQPVFNNEPPPRRPLVPSQPSGPSTNQDCDAPAGATACPAF